MAFNFVETVKSYFPAEFSSQAAKTLQEPEQNISKALTALIPASLMGILGKAISGKEGANNIFELTKSVTGISPTNALNATTDSQSANFLSDIFGSGHTGISSAISKFAGIQDSSASTLAGLVVPSIMGLLGRHATEHNLSASGLSGFLSSQKNHIMDALPPNLSSLAGMFNIGAPAEAASPAPITLVSDRTELVNPVREEFTTSPENKGGNAKWLLPLILIIIAITLLWYFSRGCNTNQTIVPESTTAVSTNADTALRPSTNMVESVKVKLPNGKELDANSGGIEDQLVTFLNSDWKSMSDENLKAKWFNFDNLNFENGKSTLLPESEKQLENISEILKAFPDAKIKIGGYTDASGDAAFNMKLSQARADVAKSGLEKRGVKSQLIGAEGYGSTVAKVPASESDAKREVDRHVSVSVRK